MEFWNFSGAAFAAWILTQVSEHRFSLPLSRYREHATPATVNSEAIAASRMGKGFQKNWN
jgi:hypothetical protein